MEQVVIIDYTNHRGERATRRIKPMYLKFTSTKWHKDQWILTAADLDKNEYRGFAMKDIHSWKTEE